MITIYHNPRCSKSRQGLAIVEASGRDFEVVKYLEDPISEEKLKAILQLLKMNPADLIRSNEAIWKAEYKGKDLSDDALVNAMLKYPKLIERPIVVNGNKAVIGRPPEMVLEIL